MGVSTPVFGFMTDDYVVADGGECKVSELIHPKVEPEIAFVTKKSFKSIHSQILSTLKKSST